MNFKNKLLEILYLFFQTKSSIYETNRASDCINLVSQFSPCTSTYFLYFVCEYWHYLNLQNFPHE